MSALTIPDAVDAAAGEAARDTLEAAPTGDRTLALVSNQMLLCSSCEQQTECTQSDESEPDAGGDCDG